MAPEDDYVWVHDYHLMLLPTLLRKRFHTVRLRAMPTSLLTARPTLPHERLSDGCGGCSLSLCVLLRCA